MLTPTVSVFCSWHQQPVTSECMETGPHKILLPGREEAMQLTAHSFLCSSFWMLSTKCYYNRARFIKRWSAGQQLRTPSYALPSCF